MNPSFQPPSDPSPWIVVIMAIGAGVWVLAVIGFMSLIGKGF